jgi:hypothetical protein
LVELKVSLMLICIVSLLIVGCGTPTMEVNQPKSYCMIFKNGYCKNGIDVCKDGYELHSVMVDPTGECECCVLE